LRNLSSKEVKAIVDLKENGRQPVEESGLPLGQLGLEQLTSGHEEGLKKRTSIDDYLTAQDDAQRCDGLEIVV
jgi:hypothetical protein